MSLVSHDFPRNLIDYRHLDRFFLRELDCAAASSGGIIFDNGFQPILRRRRWANTVLPCTRDAAIISNVDSLNNTLESSGGRILLPGAVYTFFWKLQPIQC